MAAKKSAIDIKVIRELAELLNQTELNEIEIDEGELHIRLAKGNGFVSATQAMPVAAPAVAAAPVAASVIETAVVTPKAASGPVVASPMVGTSYLSPAPGADPFVSVGDKVKKGDTVMIIEAMKTMNQIPATQDGVVASIDVVDGQPVEFGETLITLK